MRARGVWFNLYTQFRGGADKRGEELILHERRYFSLCLCVVVWISGEYSCNWTMDLLFASGCNIWSPCVTADAVPVS